MLTLIIVILNPGHSVLENCVCSPLGYHPVPCDDARALLVVMLMLLLMQKNTLARKGPNFMCAVCVCVQCVCSVRAVCVQYVCSMCAVCVQYVRSMCAVCVQYVCSMCAVCVQYLSPAGRAVLLQDCVTPMQKHEMQPNGFDCAR